MGNRSLEGGQPKKKKNHGQPKKQNFNWLPKGQISKNVYLVLNIVDCGYI